MPYWHGTKNGFDVTWLTNTNFQRGCGGNAASSAARARPAAAVSSAATGPAATPRISARRGNEVATAPAMSRGRLVMSHPPCECLLARPAPQDADARKHNRPGPRGHEETIAAMTSAAPARRWHGPGSRGDILHARRTPYPRSYVKDAYRMLIGIGGHPRSHPSHTTGHTGHVPRRFDRVKLEQRHAVGGDGASRNSGCAGLVGPRGVLTYARTPSANRRDRCIELRYATTAQFVEAVVPVLPLPPKIRA